MRESRIFSDWGLETCVSTFWGDLFERLETCVSSGENLGAVGDGRLLLVTWQKNVGDVRLHVVGLFRPRTIDSFVGWASALHIWAFFAPLSCFSIPFPSFRYK